MLPIQWLCITATKSLFNYCTYKTTNCSGSVDAHLHGLSVQNLLPMIIGFIIIRPSWLTFCHQEAADWVFGLFWNQTKLFFQSKPGQLAGYPDLLLTLAGMTFAGPMKCLAISFFVALLLSTKNIFGLCPGFNLKAFERPQL